MSSSSASETSTLTASSTSTSAAAGTFTAPTNLKVVGIILAVVSGLLIGSSFVFKKKGLLSSQAGQVAGEGVAYLKSALWWLGMIMMILGEICNFAAYAFVEAIVVTPLGALSVVVCAILSSFFLKETLTFFGWLGCGLCLLGSVIIALNGPKEETVGQIREFQKLFISPGFLVYIGVLITTSLVIIFYFAPKYGKRSMLWYIFVCSMIGGISVSVTTGLGAAIVTTAQGDNQFNHWFMYFLMAFVAITLITEVYYLNMALALFNTAMVTPTYYVIFTFFSMVTTIVLFQGLRASVTAIITLVMGFLVICFGITILQMSKVDPKQLSKLDRRSTILLQAARSQTETVEEKNGLGGEDPGIDALRGSFGTVGSIIRARRMSQSSRLSARPTGAAAPYWGSPEDPEAGLNGLKRHQLYDAPVPSPTPSLAGATKGDDVSSIRSGPSVAGSAIISKRPTIKFDSTEVVHQYLPTGQKGEGDGPSATHQHRLALGKPGVVMSSSSSGGYPPIPQTNSPPQVNPTRDLLDDSPVSVRDDDNTVRQLLAHPPAFLSEHEVRSAPPTLNAKFGRPVPGRADSRNIFDKSPKTGTLLSFPSVTDSAMSGPWDDAASAKSGSSRGRTAKRYPKGDGDDDREESVSLWQRGGGSDDDDDAPPRAGGIRLVQQPPVGDRF